MQEKDLAMPAAAGQLGQVCRLLLDKSIPDSALREAVFGIVPRGDLEIALDQVERLVRLRSALRRRDLPKVHFQIGRFRPISDRSSHCLMFFLLANKKRLVLHDVVLHLHWLLTRELLHQIVGS